MFRNQTKGLKFKVKTTRWAFAACYEKEFKKGFIQLDSCLFIAWKVASWAAENYCDSKLWWLWSIGTIEKHGRLTDQKTLLIRGFEPSALETNMSEHDQRASYARAAATHMASVFPPEASCPWRSSGPLPPAGWIRAPPTPASNWFLKEWPS